MLNKQLRNEANTGRRGTGLPEGFAPAESSLHVCLTQNEPSSFYGMRAIPAQPPKFTEGETPLQNGGDKPEVSGCGGDFSRSSWREHPSIRGSRPAHNLLPSPTGHSQLPRLARGGGGAGMRGCPRLPLAYSVPERIYPAPALAPAAPSAENYIPGSPIRTSGLGHAGPSLRTSPAGPARASSRPRARWGASLPTHPQGEVPPIV